jgi:hypothetical protein
MVSRRHRRHDRVVVQWGSVGEWVSGVGALAAVGATVTIWLGDRADRKLAEQRLIDLQAQEARRARLEQAASIHAWWHGDVQILMLWNGSSRPVHNVNVTLSWAGNRSELIRLPLLTPTPVRPYRFNATDALKPHGWNSGMHVTVKHVSFQDAQGIDWAVDEIGNLLSKAIDPTTGAGNWVVEKERNPGSARGCPGSRGS